MFIFQRNSIPAKVVVEIIYQMVIFYKKDLKKKKRCFPTMLDLIEGTPWGFFHGASQGYPLICGVDVMLYINPNHHFEVCYTSGRGSNMKAELTTIWALIFLEISVNLRDSQVVVDWINGKIGMQVIILQRVMKNIKEFLGELECIHAHMCTRRSIKKLTNYQRRC
jgi:hypothetical protein